MANKRFLKFKSKAFLNVPKLGVWIENKASGSPG
jgi:hypothetical protein